MGRFGKSIIFGGIALVLPVGAIAADVPEPPPFVYPPPVQEPSNFYLRLDFGYKDYVPPNASIDWPGGGFDVPGDGEFINENIGNSWVAGIGIGWDPAGFFRADITFDYEWPGYFEGYLLCPPACTADPDPEYSYETANIFAETLLLNGYLDFNSSGGQVTPYVGGGVGVARLTTRNVAFENPDGSTGTWTGASTWNFAWALTTGLAIDVAPRWAVDINYRYVHLGTAMAYTTLNGNTPIIYDNINAHEFRGGLRYQIR